MLDTFSRRVLGWSIDGHQTAALARILRLAASLFFFYYDALSRLDTTLRDNDATTTFSYEIDNDLKSISHQFSFGAPADFSYVYNAVHNRTQTTLSNSQFAFNFLAPPTTTYGSNNMNQYTGVDDGLVSYSLGYDGNGNLDFPANLNSYSHDVENRLISATTPTETASYTYDAFGTRTSKTVNGVVTNYILDGNQVIAEYDGNGQQLRRYVYAGIDQPIQMTTQTATYYYHADALGSVVALSNAAGSLVETYALGPYGQIAQPSPAPSVIPTSTPGENMTRRRVSTTIAIAITIQSWGGSSSPIRWGRPTGSISMRMSAGTRLILLIRWGCLRREVGLVDSIRSRPG